MGRVITIGRQFGSGGHEVGLRLAKKLGIPFYDPIMIIEKTEGRMADDPCHIRIER